MVSASDFSNVIQPSKRPADPPATEIFGVFRRRAASLGQRGVLGCRGAAPGRDCAHGGCRLNFHGLDWLLLAVGAVLVGWSAASCLLFTQAAMEGATALGTGVILWLSALVMLLLSMREMGMRVDAVTNGR